jgi:ArsR family transcriptional regulator
MPDIFDVVADSTRRDVLRLLLETSGAASGVSVGEIVGRLGLTQPTVSKHLRVLRDSGLVRVREDGQHRYYSLITTPLEDLADWVAPFVSPMDVAAVSSRSVIASLPLKDVGDRVGRAIAGVVNGIRHRKVAESAGRGVSSAPIFTN